MPPPVLTAGRAGRGGRGEEGGADAPRAMPTLSDDSLLSSAVPGLRDLMRLRGKAQALGQTQPCCPG